MTKENIITDKEKAYLKAVIEPVKDKVIFIQKVEYSISQKQFVYIDLVDGGMDTYTFEKNTQFINMELDKEYTLKELGLE